MTEKYLKTLDNLYDKILRDKTLLEKIDNEELLALFQVKRILERQESEIKILVRKHDSMQDEIVEQQATIVNLKETNNTQRMIIENINDKMFSLPFEADLDKILKNEKDEVIKQFSNKLFKLFSDDKTDTIISRITVKKIAAELTKKDTYVSLVDGHIEY